MQTKSSSVRDGPARAVAILAPTPQFTVTIEQPGPQPEVHFHPGGQGFWVARMLNRLGLATVLCGPFGGESGHLLRMLIEAEGISVRPTVVPQANGGYVHDRRHGSRDELVAVAGAGLTRHEVDNLYDSMLVESLDAQVAVLTGAGDTGALPAEFCARLSLDLGRNGVAVVADLSGEELRKLEGGVHFLKVSDEDLLRDGFLNTDSEDELYLLLRRLGSQKAANVVISRAERPALALVEGKVLRVKPPTFQPLDKRGAGDSMTAGIAAGLAQGRSLPDALRVGAAAGALNVTRHGLGTGGREDVERMAAHVVLKEVTDSAPTG